MSFLRRKTTPPSKVETNTEVTYLLDESNYATVVLKGTIAPEQRARLIGLSFGGQPWLHEVRITVAPPTSDMTMAEFAATALEQWDGTPVGS